MPAFQAGTLSAVMIKPGGGPEWVQVQNLGPSPVYFSLGEDDVTTASGVQVPAGGSWGFIRPAATAVRAICSVAQVSPADTRFERGPA